MPGRSFSAGAWTLRVTVWAGSRRAEAAGLTWVGTRRCRTFSIGAGRTPRAASWCGPVRLTPVRAMTSGIQAGLPGIAESKMARQLAKLETRYPYDIWLISFYQDNEAAEPRVSLRSRKHWNARWRWPEIRTLGDLAEPFRDVEKRFGDRIPTLSGMITGGWAQHPVSTPSLLAKKLAADRLLPVAEKLATLARLADPDFIYPAVAFRRAWDALTCNDEHGYGASYYKGRPVYDTWMQKRDWIERAEHRPGRIRQHSAQPGRVGARRGSSRCSSSTRRSSHVPRQSRSNCRSRAPNCARPAVRTERPRPPQRREADCVFGQRRFRPLGYAVFPLALGRDVGAVTKRACQEAPTVENAFYRVTFGADGTMAGIFDKQLRRQLVDASAPYRCNQFVYTRDAHKSFSSPTDGALRGRDLLAGDRP